MIVPALIAGAAAWRIAQPASPAQPQATTGPHARTCANAREARAPYVGVAVDPPITTTAKVFTSATGIRPGVVEIYASFTRGFTWAEACQVAEMGALPLIQVNFRTVHLSAIAAGHWDNHIRRYAAAVHAFGHPIALSFGHEMNGNWYPWGYTHTSPSTFIAAWRRIHDVFSQAGVTNAIWVWTVNRDSTRNAVSPDKLWWPGSAYVNWIGINGKFPRGSDTFTEIFGPSLASVRALAVKPVLLTETGIAVGPRRPAQLRSLFAGMARNPAIIGMIWFNFRASHGDWLLQGDPASDAAFRRAAQHYR